MKKVIYTKNAPEPIGPYSQAIEAGGFIYVSGQIGIDPSTGNVVEGGVNVEAKQVMENLKSIITTAGASMDDIVKSTIYLTDMSDFSKVNEVYGSYFTSQPPARETVAVVGLPKNVQVEISVIVIKRN